MRRKFCVSFLIILFGAYNAFSNGTLGDSTQTLGQMMKSDSIFSLKSRKGYIPSLVHNFGEQMVAPFKMSTKDAIYVAGATGITALLFYFDHDIDERIRLTKSKYHWVDVTSPEVTELGDYYGYAFVAGFGLGSALLKENKAMHTALMASQAMITSGTWVRLVKYMTSRERPSASYTSKGHPGGYWYGSFKEFSSISDNRDISYFDAFPSGHTSTAFSIATVFAMQYNDSKIIPALAYSTATIVGFTRMIEHTHWASDIFAGACFGYLCGKQVVIHHRKVNKSVNGAQNSGKQKPVFLLQPSSQGYGLALTGRW